MLHSYLTPFSSSLGTSVSEEMKYINLKNLTRFMAFQPIKKLTLLFSVSLLSFLFSSSSFVTQYSLKYSLSLFPLRLLSHAVDKSYVFLICNGILMVLLAKGTSGMVSSRSSFDPNDLIIQNQSDNEPVLNVAEPEEEEEEEVIKQIIVEAKVEEKENGFLEKMQEENSNLALVEYKQEPMDDSILDEEIKEAAGDLEAANDQENNENIKGFFIKEEVAEESDEPLDKLSMEELNKKFEEFIRRMKEDIRIEARQQLVLVK